MKKDNRRGPHRSGSWLDRIPSTLGDLRGEELQCRPGDWKTAIIIRDRLRDYMDTHRRTLSLVEAKWLRSVIKMWNRRIDRPSAWFELYGDRLPARGETLTKRYREDRSLLKVDQILRRVEREQEYRRRSRGIQTGK